MSGYTAYKLASASAGERTFTPISGGKCLRFPVITGHFAASADAIKGASLKSGSALVSKSNGLTMCPESTSISINSASNSREIFSLWRYSTSRYSASISAQYTGNNIPLENALSNSAGVPCGDRKAETQTLVSMTAISTFATLLSGCCNFSINFFHRHFV